MHPFDVIATDLDGTFLDDAKRVPDINARAVRLAAAEGIPTIYATGRPARWFGVLDELADTHGYAVAANGALTLDLAERKVLHTRVMSPSLVAEVSAEIRALLPQARFAVEYIREWGAEPTYPPRAEDPQFRASLDDLLYREPLVKLLVLDQTTPTAQLAAAVEELTGDRLTVTFSYLASAGMLEISAAGVSKALALAELLDDLDIDPARMIAFGDMPNDMAMLELAGLGYAMDGSHPWLFEAGHARAGDNNDGGVGRTILRLLGAEDADR